MEVSPARKLNLFWPLVIGLVVSTTAFVIVLIALMFVMRPGDTAAVLAVVLGIAAFFAACGGLAQFMAAFVRSARDDESPLIESHWGGYGGGLGGWRVSPAAVYLLGAIVCGSIVVALGFQGMAQVSALAKSAATQPATTQPATTQPSTLPASGGKGAGQKPGVDAPAARGGANESPKPPDDVPATNASTRPASRPATAPAGGP